MKDDGQAFPGEYSTFEYQGDPVYGGKTRIYHHSNGMKLRDYFAAKAMQGMLSELPSGYIPESIAMASYLMADAMIEKREK